jgi:hypothetical protein
MRSVLMMAATMGMLTGPALAQQILRAEPPPGKLATGEVILVDDGRCPAGQVREVTGIRQRTRDSLASADPSATRSRRCVQRPR